VSVKCGCDAIEYVERDGNDEIIILGASSRHFIAHNSLTKGYSRTSSSQRLWQQW